MPKTKIPAVISTFCLCFLFWVLLTWSFTPQEMIAGAVVSLAAALFTSGFFIHENAFRLANPVRFGALIAYVFIFLGELVKANNAVIRMFPKHVENKIRSDESCSACNKNIHLNTPQYEKSPSATLRRCSPYGDLPYIFAE